jgi:hypothetical protein
MMLKTLYADIRHMNFWYGEYGLCDKSCNDEITIYSDPYKKNKLGYFEITTHKCLTYVYSYELNDEDDYDYKKEIEEFLNGGSKIAYYYIFPNGEEDLQYQVNHFAPLNKENHKPKYIYMWTKLSEDLNANEIKNCVKIFAKEFLHENVSNVVLLEVPTYEETKKDYDEDWAPFL